MIRTLKGRVSVSVFRAEQGAGAVAATDAGLLEVFLPFGGETEEEVRERVGRVLGEGLSESELTRIAASLLERYFRGARIDFSSLPLDLSSATGFRRRVLEVVATIPYGTVMTYGEVARQVGNPNGARAVGGAMASNLLPVIIPCHRVVGSSGALTGYTAPGGMASKKWLLAMEGVVATKIAVSKEKTQ